MPSVVHLQRSGTSHDWLICGLRCCHEATRICVCHILYLVVYPHFFETISLIVLVFSYCVIVDFFPALRIVNLTYNI